MSCKAFELSPCVGICRLRADNICRGCYRHTDEIRGWGLMSEEEQRKILARVAERRLHLLPEPDSSHD
jgi:predicted Fe-S protein YdhL (DUF1289 family)